MSGRFLLEAQYPSNSPGSLSIALIVLASHLLVGCGIRGPQLPALVNPTLAPTATAVPATGFERGALEVPEGFVLMLSIHRGRVCTTECDCPLVEGLPPGYNIVEDDLYLFRSAKDVSWGSDTSPPIVLAHGDFEETLVFIDHLPYLHERVEFPLLAAAEDGTVVYEWQGLPYRLAKGSAWQVSSQADHGTGCVITHFSILRNHGSWSEDHVEILD